MPTALEKQENKLKGDLFTGIRKFIPAAILFTHQDVRGGGIPDGSLTSNKKTLWLECKHGTPDFESKGNQELNMLRLDTHGYARYIIWQEFPDGRKRTLIVRPRNIKMLLPEAECEGFDHAFIIRYLLATFNE